LDRRSIAVLVGHEQPSSRADKILGKLVDELVELAAGPHRLNSITLNFVTGQIFGTREAAPRLDRRIVPKGDGCGPV